MEVKPDNKIFIKKIIKKYENETELKISGKTLNYILDDEILIFYCTLYKSTNINPSSSDIYFNFEFKDNSTPYVQILNDFINPTLNDGRNIYYCLTNKHKYIFNKNNLDECENIFYELIDNIKEFLICLKENIQINAFIYYGNYEKERTYKINELILSKNTIKFFRIMQINGKEEYMKYVIITQLYFLIFEPDENDMSFAKLELCLPLKDIQFAFEEINPNKKPNTNNFTLKILSDINFNEILNMKFYLYSNDKIVDNLQTKFIEFKTVLFSKKGEIDLKKYKIVITNYKPLFTIDTKKVTKRKHIKGMHDDYKLYIAYYEELYNYYKDFKEENIKNRVKIYLANLTYFCVDFITFYDSEPDEVKYYKDKMSNYLDKSED